MKRHFCIVLYKQCRQTDKHTWNILVVVIVVEIETCIETRGGMGPCTDETSDSCQFSTMYMKRHFCIVLYKQCRQTDKHTWNILVVVIVVEIETCIETRGGMGPCTDETSDSCQFSTILSTQ